MATKIRLQRHGRRDYAYYKIVVADSRAPRDGKFIERLGSYNPNTNPATIDLNFDRALYWLNVGAQPTDTTRNILSREGVMLKKHLEGGVKKGSFDQAEADRRFEAWLKGKKDSLLSARDKDVMAKEATEKARLDSEKEINAAKAKALAEKRAAASRELAESARRAAEEVAAAEAEANGETSPAAESAEPEAPEVESSEAAVQA